MAPRCSEYVPLGQSVQFPAPAAENVPGVQSVALVEPIRQDEPEGQVKHDRAPDVFENVPAAQGVELP